MLSLSLFIILIYSSVINSLDITINKISTLSIGYINKNKYLVRIGIIILIYSLYIIKDIILDIIYNNNINNINIFNDIYSYNIYNIYIIILIYIVVISLLSINSTNLINIILKKEIFNEFNIFYISIILFNVLGIILLLTSNNLLSLFISIELQSYSLYILTGIIPKSQTSGHNSLFYYLIGGLGSIIILYGISLIYYITSNIDINNINILINLYNNNNNLLINNPYINNILLGWLILIFGLLIKIGIAPMYHWSILLYTNSNTIITSYISIIPKISILSYILYLINKLNIYNIYLLNTSAAHVGYDANNNIYINKFILILTLLITLSLLIGSISGLTQIKIKSILAYSGLLNLGYLLLPILINNNNSIIAYIIYLSQYSLNHISIFLLLIISILYINNNINNYYNNNNINYQHLTYVYELSNIKNNIYLVISLIIIIGSFIGIPPLFGFYGKYYLLISSINNNNLLLSLLLIISSIISTIFYLYFLNIVIIKNNTNKLINKSIINIKSIINNDNNHIIKLSNNLLTYILSSYILIIIFNFIQWDNILKGAYIISLIFN